MGEGRGEGMRITNQMIFERLNSEMMSSQESLNQAQQRVTTGKNINTPSDDPAAAGRILGYKTILSKTDQYSQNITSVQLKLNLTGTLLESGVTTFGQISDAVRQSLSTNTTAADRQETAKNVQYSLNQLVSLANTKIGDSYLFGGYGGNTDPFDASGNPTGNISGDIKVEVDKGVTVSANSPGDRVFQGVGVAGGVDVFSVINNLITSLNANDDAGIRTALSDLVAARNQFRNEAVDVANRKSFVGITEKQVTGVKNSITETLSKEENVDMATAVTDFRAKELALEAVRSASARVLNMPTLFDFLK